MANSGIIFAKERRHCVNEDALLQYEDDILIQGSAASRDPRHHLRQGHLLEGAHHRRRGDDCHPGKSFSGPLVRDYLCYGYICTFFL